MNLLRSSSNLPLFKLCAGVSLKYVQNVFRSLSSPGLSVKVIKIEEKTAKDFALLMAIGIFIKKVYIRESNGDKTNRGKSGIGGCCSASRNAVASVLAHKNRASASCSFNYRSLGNSFFVFGGPRKRKFVSTTKGKMVV